MKKILKTIIERSEILTPRDRSMYNHFMYAMLSTLKDLCNYFINSGHGDVKILYFDDVNEHIKIMKAIYHHLPERPECCKLEDISDLRRRMRLYDSVDEAKEAIKNCHEKVGELCVVAACYGKYMVAEVNSAIDCGAKIIR